MECNCLHGGVIENSRACKPLTLRSVPVLVHVQVWVHILGGPQCSAQERYSSQYSETCARALLERGKLA